MNYRSQWRWNPIRGEYEIPPAEPLHGTGEISAIDAFSNRTIFLLGATGFVGKVLLAMMLDRFPELKHIVIQVRRKRTASGEQRFFNEVLQSPPLRPVVARIGEAKLREKFTIVEGDVNEALCGVQPEMLERLKGKVDVVLNLAGLVEFDPPLNESLVPNVYGVQHLIELVKLLKAKLIHVSTCYVAGKKDGRISEDTAIIGYYPKRQGQADTKFNVDDELRWCEQFVETTRAGARNDGSRSLREELRDGGMNRAESWGWINTYTYTKSMGEQLIAKALGIDFAIVRPAIVESSLRFPFPGWNEGLTTSAPLVLMGGEGLKGWPVRKDGPLEIIPVDLVAEGILIVTAATLCGKNKPVYHLATADQNPVMLPRLVAFLGMNSRYKHKRKTSGNKMANLWKAYVETEVITMETLEARRNRLHRGIDVIHAMLNVVKSIVGNGKVDPYLKSLRTTRRQIRQAEQTLDKFLPFMIHNSFVFETKNIRQTVDMLTDEDRTRLAWDPESIDWADYWVNIHTKGIEKWIRPAFAAPQRKPVVA
jgi:long-chain acyl-CoA synthetase